MDKVQKYRDGRRYYALDAYLKDDFGQRLVKLPINAGFTCPNRDGTCGVAGCSFCAGGASEFAPASSETVERQLAIGKAAAAARGAAGPYIAYYQSFTNTYAPVAHLQKIYAPAFLDPEVRVVSIATRPDCLPEEVCDLLAAYNRMKPVWVELGVQTLREKSAVDFGRGYDNMCFYEAVRKLRSRGITVIVHVILGLPHETAEDVHQTVEGLNSCDVQGIKLQLLHVMEGTKLAVSFQAGDFDVLTKEAYIDLVCDCIGWLSPDIVIHRLTGDGAREGLIAPLWSLRKGNVLNSIHHRLKARDIRQGCLGGERYGGRYKNTI